MKTSVWTRLTVWIEYVIVTRVVSRRVGPLMRLFFKTPILFYRVGLGGLVGKRILLLGTTGRRTGKHRLTPLEYSYDEGENVYFLMSGWGGRSDWYRNALAHPEVQLQVGKKSFTGRAEPAAREDVVRLMETMLQAYPKAVNTWSGYSGVAYDGTRESLERMAAAFPSLLIHPQEK